MDDWEAADDDTEDDDPVEDDPDENESDDSHDTASQVSDASAASVDNIMSGIPLKLKLLPGKIHLLNPKIHKSPVNSTYSETKVPTATPLKLQ